MRNDPAAHPEPVTVSADPIAGPAPVDAVPAAAAPSGDPTGHPGTLEHLFRYASRAGRVHPLQPLLQRYRAGERA